MTFSRTYSLVFVLLPVMVRAAMLKNDSMPFIDDPNYNRSSENRTESGREWFMETFEGSSTEFKERWEFAGYWANGQPFNNGWDPSFYSINQWSVLELFLKKQKFTHATGTYDYTAGEIRSKDFFSTGCYSVCMKASPESGVSSSFYLLNTKWDSPFPRPPNDNFHNEIDIEFVGANTSRMQSNFYSRQKDPQANSASGNEQWHDLGFDAAQSFNSYSMKWSGWGIEWFVNERLVRTALRNESQDMPDPFYSPMRVVANIWPVDSKTIQWAGQVSDNFMFTKAEYAWIRFEAGETCQILSDCGF